MSAADRTRPASRTGVGPAAGRTVLERVLGALFTLMALLQALDVRGFADVLTTYDVPLPSTPLASVLIALELAVGLSLLLRPALHRREVAAGFTVVAVVYAVLAFQAFARGLVVPNCGCFGVFLAQELRWWVLLQEVLLLVYSAVLLRKAEH